MHDPPCCHAYAGEATSTHLAEVLSARKGAAPLAPVQSQPALLSSQPSTARLADLLQQMIASSEGVRVATTGKAAPQTVAEALKPLLDLAAAASRCGSIQSLT